MIRRAVGKCGVDKLEHIKLSNSHVDIQYVMTLLNAAYSKLDIDSMTDDNYIHITCDDTREVLLQRLNPEFAEQRQQKQEIDALKVQMSEMMLGMKELMAQLKKEDTKKE